MLKELVSSEPGYLFTLLNEGVTVSGVDMLAKVQSAVEKGVPLVYFLNRIRIVTQYEVTSLYTFLTTPVAKEVFAIAA